VNDIYCRNLGFVTKDNVLKAALLLMPNQLMEGGVNLEILLHAAELVVVELDIEKEAATILRK